MKIYNILQTYQFYIVSNKKGAIIKFWKIDNPIAYTKVKTQREELS